MLADEADALFYDICAWIGVDYYRHCRSHCSPLEFMEMALGTTETAH